MSVWGRSAVTPRFQCFYATRLQSGRQRSSEGQGERAGARSVVAESVLVKQQLLVLNRCRKRSPNLCPSDRVVAGLCAVFIRPGRLIRSAIVFKASLLSLHRALVQRKYRRLFGSKEPMKPGPNGLGQEVIAAVVDMKQRNPSWGRPRIAQQIDLAFGIPIDRDVVRRILAARYQPKPDSGGRRG
jgi:putative transposase